MRTIYVSDDGKEFDDEYECERYEWIINNPDIENIHIYDKDGNELVDLFSENTYDKSHRIEIPDEKTLEALHKLADYIGFHLYNSINDCGDYVYDNEDFVFVKEV